MNIDTKRLTIRLGKTEPTSKQYESIRADVTIEYEFGGVSGTEFYDNYNNIFKMLAQRNKNMLTTALQKAQETGKDVETTDKVEVDKDILAIAAKLKKELEN
tara:strand:- start:2361 stop:2666 length:306 start_codon:yes stop_codon:yes gene_type:complete